MYTEEELDKNIIRQQLLEDPEGLDIRLSEMPSYRRQVTMATLEGDKHWPSVIAAFAKLCDSLAAEWIAPMGQAERHDIYVVMDSNRIVREKTFDELVDTVAQSIADQRRAQNLTETTAQEQVAAWADMAQPAE